MTSLRGNLSIVDLANILQMLQMNQREGTLHIVGPEGRKAVYFGLDGVSTLNCGQNRQITIGKILVRNGMLTEEQLDEALRRQSQSSGRMLGQIVVEQGLVTREDVEHALRTQVEEEIYDLFISKDAQFEFLEGDLPQELAELRSQNRISFNVNTLIMEAAQRIDEWEWIQDVVSDPREIYRYSGANVPLEDPIFSEPAGGRILTSIDGRRNVDELMEHSYAGRFQVYKVVGLLVQAGALEPVTPDDLRSEAEKSIAAGDAAATIKFLGRLVELHEENADTHLRLAEAYEGERELERAAFHYRVYAETRIESAETHIAFRIYERIFEMVPTDLAAADRMIEVFTMNPDGLEGAARLVIATGKSLAETYVELGRTSRAIQVLHRIVSLGPDDTDLRSRLIDVYLEAGMSGEALAEYDALAELALARNELDRAEQIFRKMLSIDPDRSDAMARLSQLISRRTQRRRSVRNSIATAAVVTILGVAGWYGVQYWLDFRADLARGNALAEQTVADLRQRHAGLSVEISALLTQMAGSASDEDRLLEQIQSRNGERLELERRANVAIRELNSAVKAHAGTPAAEGASANADALKYQLKELERTTQDAVARLAVRAQALYLEGRDLANSGATTREQFEKFERAMRVGSPCGDWLRSGDGLDCQAYFRSLKETIAELEDARSEIEARVAEGDIERAFDRAITFLGTYPPPDLSAELHVPLVVDSLPPGARIMLDGEPTEQLTPAAVLVPLRDGARIELTLDGFDTTILDVPPVVESEPRAIAAQLERETLVALERTARLVSSPVAGKLRAPAELFGDFVVIPTRSEHVEVFDIAADRRVAPFVLRNPSGSRVAPARGGDVLAVFGADGVVSFHDFASRRFLGAYELPGEVRTHPVSAHGLTLVPTASSHVVALNVATRREVWRFPARGAAPLPARLLGTPVLSSDELLCTDGRGGVSFIDPRSGSLRRRLALRGLDGPLEPAHAVGADATHLVAIDHKGNVTKLDRHTGEPLWSVSIGRRAAYAPLLCKGRVLIVDSDGLLVVLDGENGAISAELAIGAAATDAPVLEGTELLVGDMAARVSLIDVSAAEPRLLWRHEVRELPEDASAGSEDATDEEPEPLSIATRPSSRGGWVLFGTSDGRVHAVTR